MEKSSVPASLDLLVGDTREREWDILISLARTLSALILQGDIVQQLSWSNQGSNGPVTALGLSHHGAINLSSQEIKIPGPVDLIVQVSRHFVVVG